MVDLRQRLHVLVTRVRAHSIEVYPGDIVSVCGGVYVGMCVCGHVCVWCLGVYNVCVGMWYVCGCVYMYMYVCGCVQCV